MTGQGQYYMSAKRHTGLERLDDSQTFITWSPTPPEKMATDWQQQAGGVFAGPSFSCNTGWRMWWSRWLILYGRRGKKYRPAGRDQ